MGEDQLAMSEIVNLILAENEPSLLLLRLHFLCRNASEDRHQHFLKLMNNRIASTAFYRMRCEQGLQQRGLISSGPPIEIDRWLVQLPVMEKSQVAHQAVAAKGILMGSSMVYSTTRIKRRSPCFRW